MEIKTVERFTEHENKLYLLRDVWVDNRLVKCEFAERLDGSQQLTWTAFPEGGEARPVCTIKWLSL